MCSLPSVGAVSPDTPSAVSSVPASKEASSKKASSVKKASSAAESKIFVPKREEELRAVWFSFLDIDELKYAGKTKEQAIALTDQIMDELKSYKINAVILHARAHGDAFYKSALFPSSKYLSVSKKQGEAPNFDLLQIMIDSAHKRGIEIHAWFNPYRVGGEKDTIATLADSNKAKKWAADPVRKTWVVDFKESPLSIAGGGIYYNPAVPEVQRLILDGVREVLANYDVDGIHFDDYFYMTQDERFDSKEYAGYKAGGGARGLHDWRRMQVNSLVTGIYAATKFYSKEKNKNIVFGVSPFYDKDRNRIDYYADVEYWLKSSSFVDYICPQLYFGFDYPLASARFKTIADKWAQLIKNPDITLYVGLASYKTGALDPKPKDPSSIAPGADEWVKKDDLIKRQVEYARGLPGYGGFMLFRLRPLCPERFGASYKDLLVKQRVNLLGILN